MLNKMYVENKEFDFKELIKDYDKLLEDYNNEQLVNFHVTIKDKKDTIETILTMEKIIKALFYKINDYDEYLNVLIEDNKRLYEENDDYRISLMNTQNTIERMTDYMIQLNTDIQTTLSNEEEEEW